MLDIEGLELTGEDRDLLRHPQTGGLILFARNYASREQLSALVASVRELRSPPVLIAVDQEGGRVQRFRDDFSRLPPLRTLGDIYDADANKARHLAVQSARLMAMELLAHDIDFSFAPVLDLDYGCCEVIGNRALHREPDAVANLALAYMHGLRMAGMAAVAKHFPGHGAVTADSHLALPEDPRAYAELLDDMAPYRSLIEAGLQGVMMAHIRYTAVSSEVASLSHYWMTDILRRELGFQGAIFSDDLSMAGAEVGGTIPQRAQLALAGGADMVLLCNNRPAAAGLLESLENYDDPAAHGRLAAMRADHSTYAQAPYGEAIWRSLAAEIERLEEFQLHG
jgi:beta-N-acetylhexosaminidase